METPNMHYADFFVVAYCPSAPKPGGKHEFTYLIRIHGSSYSLGHSVYGEGVGICPHCNRIVRYSWTNSANSETFTVVGENLPGRPPSANSDETHQHVRVYAWVKTTGTGKEPTLRRVPAGQVDIRLRGHIFDATEQHPVTFSAGPGFSISAWVEGDVMPIGREQLLLIPNPDIR